MAKNDGLVDPRLGRRIIAETRLRRNELRIERAINKALDAHMTKTIATLNLQAITASVPPDAFDLASWDSSVQDFIRPVIDGVLIDQAEWTFKFLALPPEVRAEILGLIDIESLVDSFVERVRTVGPETAQRVMGELSAGIIAGESIDKLTMRLSDSFDVAKRNGARIARTETHGAAEATTYRSAGAIAGAGFSVTKEWLATSDARTRKSHAAADGQRVPVDEPFTVGGVQGDHPGAMGKASLDINCRCSVVYDIPE